MNVGKLDRILNL